VKYYMTMKRREFQDVEGVWEKTYIRYVIRPDNKPPRFIIEEAKKLADVLQMPHEDLLGDLVVTIDISVKPRHKRLLQAVRRQERRPRGL